MKPDIVERLGVILRLLDSETGIRLDPIATKEAINEARAEIERLREALKRVCDADAARDEAINEDSLSGDPKRREVTHRLFLQADNELWDAIDAARDTLPHRAGEAE